MPATRVSIATAPLAAAAPLPDPVAPEAFLLVVALRFSDCGDDAGADLLRALGCNFLSAAAAARALGCDFFSAAAAAPTPLAGEPLRVDVPPPEPCLR